MDQYSAASARESYGTLLGRIQRADAQTRQVGCVSGGIPASVARSPVLYLERLEEVRLALAAVAKARVAM